MTASADASGTLLRKRVYDAEQPADGYRVLIDRLWPRGESRVSADLGEWLKDIAPSTDLRRWWDHDPARMAEFARRYAAQLDANEEPVQHLLDLLRQHPVVTLLYAAHDADINHAVVLQDYMHDRFDVAVLAPTHGKR